MHTKKHKERTSGRQGEKGKKEKSIFPLGC